MAGKIASSIGLHGFWGYSAGFDLLEAVNSVNKDDSEEVLNILLIQPSDIRHVLTTISKRRRHTKNKSFRPIHFYLLENPMEVIARDMLLLDVLFDFEVPIRQRANIFLEIFGNCKVQDRTCRYIDQKGVALRQFCAKGTGNLEDLVDLSCLKFRDRDNLEDCFKAYSRSMEFDMTSLRDHRLRGHYEERYDSRAAAADWDYHYALKVLYLLITVLIHMHYYYLKDRISQAGM